MELILSVTVAKVWPGAMTGGRPGPTEIISCCSSLISGGLDLRVRVAQRGQIRSARARIHFGQERIIQGLGFHFRNAAGGIVDIAEYDGLRGARTLAGGLDL